MQTLIISSWRSQTAETFERLRFQAATANFFAKLTGKTTQLKGLAAELFRLNSAQIARGEQPLRPTAQRLYRGEQEVPLAQITGSVGREHDFDHHFRPLKKHLRDRWIEVSALFATDRVPPITVYKCGNAYFVEDGHHRVSVARALGQLSLRALVWEIPTPSRKETSCEICLPAGQKKKSRTLAHA